MDSFTLEKIEFAAVRGILRRYCACSLGKHLADGISPLRDPGKIRTWLDQTSQMVAAVRDVSLPPFGGVTDISEHLARAKPGGSANGEDYATIASALAGAANVKAYLNSLDEKLGLLHDLAGKIGVFTGEVEAVRAVLEPDGSVRDDASEKLASLRRQIAQATQDVHDVIYGYLRRPDVAKLLQSATVALNGDRYVLPVKAENRGRLRGVVHRASNTGATVFVEPAACVELNNKLTDLAEDERREVQRLLNELAFRIAPRADEIAATLRVLGQVDLLSAKAQYAYQFDMVRPEMTERGGVQVFGAKHPLLVEQAHQQGRAGIPAEVIHPVVPIDVRLGTDFDVLVVTGSNTGGKTVALKTVALLAAMAQAGCHIPAQPGARLPVFRDVFIDVGDEQSLQQSLSTFGAHVERIRFVLGKADAWSLVLLDELGAGTDPDEGGAIGQAVLDEILRIGCLAMVTTHLSVLKAYAVNRDRVDNASVEFDTATLSPTYHLRIGTPGQSHAIAVARKLGLSKRITEAAKQRLVRQRGQFNRAIRATGEVRKTAEAARKEAHEARLSAEAGQEAYEAKLADLHGLQHEFETWLARLSELKPGDQMAVPSMGKTGRLVRLELHKQIAVVDCDQMQVEVPLSQLMPDLGHKEVRDQIAAMRKDILAQARQSQADAEASARVRDEFHKSLVQQRARAERFDRWLGAIGRMRIGDEIPITRKPGAGKLVQVNLPGLRATVLAGGDQIELPLSELFPQTGPFAPHRPKHARTRKSGPQGGKTPAGLRPMRRRSAASPAGKASRKALLDAKPGQKVFVVPFKKQATILRVNADKGLAVVQSGVFELEVHLADLEPIGREGS